MFPIVYATNTAGLSELNVNQTRPQRFEILVHQDEYVAEGTYRNQNPTQYKGGLLVGVDFRAWLMFDLISLPSDMVVLNATVYLTLLEEEEDADMPLGIYFSSDDFWSEGDITWVLQPEIEPNPTDVIDSPDSPDMFQEMWVYGWNVTQDVIREVSGNNLLTEVITQVSDVDVGLKCFVESEYETEHIQDWKDPYMHVWMAPPPTTTTPHPTPPPPIDTSPLLIGGIAGLGIIVVV
ncbi:MAG: DNRLRE domain-containing protein, partial [Candidatus Thorarchaeota archaeon]